MQVSKRSALPAVTGLRFVLAMWVVVLHLGTVHAVFGAWVRRLPSFVQGLVHSGASGVGIFFLLSGFVLAYNYDLASARSGMKLGSFWVARLARISNVDCSTPG